MRKGGGVFVERCKRNEKVTRKESDKEVEESEKKWKDNIKDGTYSFLKT